MYPSSLPNIDLQVLPTFPANVVATGAVDISKSGLSYTFGVNFQNVIEETNVSDMSKREVLVQDTDTGAFWRVKLTNLPTGQTDWANIQNKPTEFPPSPHTHPVSQISDATPLGQALLTAADAAAARGLLNIGAGVLAGFRNKIINGDFEIHQRGTGAVSGHSQFGADRWLLVPSAGANVSLQRLTNSDAAADQIPSRPAYHMRFNVTTPGSGPSYFEQRIENVATLQGKRATLTFWARGSGLSNFGVQMFQHFGTGGAASTPVLISSTTFTITGSYVRRSVVIDIPSISGKVLGTNGNHHVIVRFTVADTAGTGYVDISHVSLVEGDASFEVDPFSPRHIQQELALCQRYYWQGQAVGNGSGYLYAAANQSSLEGPVVALPVPMRVIPSVAIVAEPTYTACSHAALTPSGNNGIMHRLTKDGTTGLYRAEGGVYSASGEI